MYIIRRCVFRTPNLYFLRKTGSYSFSNHFRHFSSGDEELIAEKHIAKKARQMSTFEKIKSFFGFEISDPEPQIFSIVRSGDVDSVLKALKEDKKLLRTRFEGHNIVTFAAELGNTELVVKLLDNGGRVNAENQKTGYTLLHYAAKQNNEELLDIILEKASNLKLALPELEHGLSPLHIAAIEGNYVIVEKLVKAGAPIKQRDTFGYTSLHVACLKRNLAVARFLKDADPEACTLQSYEHADRMLPMHIAADQVDPDMMALLADASPLLGLDKNGRNVGHYLAKHGFVDMLNDYVDLVEKNGFGLNIATVQLDDEGLGEEDLQAVKKERLQELRQHISLYKSAGSEKIDRDTIFNFLCGGRALDGTTPLIVAVDAGHYDYVKYLIDKKCVNVNAAVKIGLTPLHFAVRNGDVKMTELLLENGADATNGTATNNITPLHFAVRFGRTDLFGPLLKKGARWDAVDGVGACPLVLDSDASTCHDVGNLFRTVLQLDQMSEATLRTELQRLLAIQDERMKVIVAETAAKQQQQQNGKSSKDKHIHDENCKH
eukprot:GDKJ01005131.1.p1 GENE.GDKJ01005131.1~~GDKJ01005131.1.p1  ORF type:complete len:547 (+),score=128.48 GDKJ01005131.1:56-1696(+)